MGDKLHRCVDQDTQAQPMCKANSLDTHDVLWNSCLEKQYFAPFALRCVVHFRGNRVSLLLTLTLIEAKPALPVMYLVSQFTVDSCSR